MHGLETLHDSATQANVRLSKLIKSLERGRGMGVSPFANIFFEGGGKKESAGAFFGQVDY